jgi:hypothetical protein
MAGAPEGNTNAAGRKNKLFNAALLRAIAQDDQGDANKLRKAAEQLLTLAAQGEQWAVKELADRLDGKSKQQIEATGLDDGPIQHKVEVVIVDASSPSSS